MTDLEIHPGAAGRSGQDELTRLAAVRHAAGVTSGFDARLAAAGHAPLRATGIEVFQINVGKLCNQTCAHCHVDAGPTRTEVMTQETAELCMRVLGETDIGAVDLTGGAPELCPSFEYLVRESRRLGRRVMDRCNLTVLMLPRFEGLSAFFAEHQVEVVASLPHHRELATDRQRGAGVHARSLDGLRRLNALGYGQEGSGLELTLVTNPVGAFLPANQASLEAEWKAALLRDHGVVFDRLISITNMPIRRYLDWLEASGNLDDYQRTLVQAFNPAAVDGLMCRTTLSVGWQGELYDCDFNQMLDLGLGHGAPRHLSEFDLNTLADRRIVTGPHCFGCTAGAGSSCGGKTT